MDHSTDSSPAESEPSRLRAFAWAALVVAALAILGVWVEPHYRMPNIAAGSTDDVRMAMVVAGVGDPAGPSEHLLYSNRLIGKTLCQLHASRPDVAWYGLYLLASHLLAILAVLWSILAVTADRVFRVLALAVVLAIHFWFWISLVFTSTAVLLTAGGIALIVASMTETREARNWLSIRETLGWLLIVFASMIRWQAAGFALLVLAPALLADLWMRRRDVALVRALVAGAVALALMFGLRIWDQSIRQSAPEWKAFTEFEAPAAWLVNNERAYHLIASQENWDDLPEEVRAALSSVGWNLNDAQIAMRWYLVDEGVFSADKLRRAHERLVAGWRPPLSSVPSIIGVALQNFLARQPLLLFVVASVASIVVCRPQRWQLLIVAAMWSVCISLAALAGVLVKLATHVFYPAGAGCWVAALLVCAAGRRASGSRPAARSLLRCGSCAVTLALAGYVLFDALRLSRLGAQARPEFQQELTQIAADRESFYVLMLPFPFHRIHPLDNLSGMKEWNFVYLDGWQQSPRQKRILAHAGISQLTEAIHTNSSVRIIANPTQIRLLEQFLADHEHATAHFEPLRSNQWFTVYAVVRDR